MKHLKITACVSTLILLKVGKFLLLYEIPNNQEIRHKGRYENIC